MRLAERVDHAAEQRVADRDRLDPPGRLDDLLLLELSTSPSTTAPMVSSSRFSARPSVPSSNSSSSLTRAPGSPDTRAMPSPTSTMRPTCSEPTSGVYSATCRRSASVISAASIVSSAISLLPARLDRRCRWSRWAVSQVALCRCSRSASSRPRAVASTCRSPTRTSTPRAGAGRPSPAARPASRPAASATATAARARRRRPAGPARTRATRHPRARAVSSTRKSSVPTMSRARPPAIA